VTAAALWPPHTGDAYHAPFVDPDVVLAKARQLAGGPAAEQGPAGGERNRGDAAGGERNGGDAAGGDVDKVALLIAEAGGDRQAVEAARDRVAAHLHRAVDDYEATVMLQLLNRALSRMPRVDPLDWRVRWHQRFRKP